MNQNATQFGNTETEKGLGRECCLERGKNKVTDANATSLEAELYKSFKLCFIAGISLYFIKCKIQGWVVQSPIKLTQG